MNPGNLDEIERSRLRALVDADVVAADQLHADDFQLITPGGDSLSKEEYLQGIASGQIDYLSWEPEEIEARVHEEPGCLRYRSTIRIVVAGRELEPVGFGTRTSTKSVEIGGRSSGRRRPRRTRQDRPKRQYGPPTIRLLIARCEVLYTGRLTGRLL